MEIFNEETRDVLHEALFKLSEKPGEVYASIHRHTGKELHRDFPTLKKAEAWLRVHAKKDVGKDNIFVARFYVYGKGWYEYKPDRLGIWMKNPSGDPMTLFKLYK